MKNILKESKTLNSEFIQNTKLNFDLDQIVSEYNDFISSMEEFVLGEWRAYNQLSLKCRNNVENQYLDGIGSLYNQKTKQFEAEEKDFINYVDGIGEYTKSVIESIETKENVKIGRARYMLMPAKRGLSIHYDLEQRYHIAIKTQPTVLFGEYTGDEICAKCYNIPANGSVYKVDTTRNHFVFNGSWEDRIHLVLCLR